ncbi:hypothetical protein ACPXCE_18625 [Streptomyces sp. DT24]|uniref:hypothetical protein n=1 Tax=unclassified Streptomyces TaxID=2593676 RepID=UPI0023B94655|nr:hypothetical protein [Streptomyces sp. AM 4-1-1]WEH34081.1 hypothetical protein PZB75_12290 [Streptomyces sp. AM 4-1-1]
MSESVEPLRDPVPVVTEPVPDVQLQLLVRLLGDELRSSLPVTLNIPSGVLSGELISHEAWKAEWARSLRQVEGGGANLIANFPETVDQGLDELAAEDGPQSLPRWIHLRDATLVAGGPHAVTLPLWRGRLADVSGWALGRPREHA